MKMDGNTNGQQSVVTYVKDITSNFTAKGITVSSVHRVKVGKMLIIQFQNLVVNNGITGKQVDFLDSGEVVAETTRTMMWAVNNGAYIGECYIYQNQIRFERYAYDGSYYGYLLVPLA